MSIERNPLLTDFSTYLQVALVVERRLGPDDRLVMPRADIVLNDYLHRVFGVGFSGGFDGNIEIVIWYKVGLKDKALPPELSSRLGQLPGVKRVSTASWTPPARVFADHEEGSSRSIWHSRK